MERFWTRSNAAMACTVLVALPPPAQAGQAQYTVTDLGMLRGAINVVPTALNDHGEVVGRALFPASDPPVLRAWKWTAATGIELLPSPPGFGNYEADAINNAGQIAGDSGNFSEGQAWRFHEGFFLLLGIPPGQTASTTAGMNNAGDVAGTGLDAMIVTPQEVFLFSDRAGMQNIDTAPGSIMHAAAALNDVQQVVGHTNQNLPFRWTPAPGGGIEILPVTSPYAIGFPYGINSNGDVVGEVKSANGQLRAAFLCTDGNNMEIIADIASGDDFDRANSINDQGVVAGASHLAGQEAGWIWSSSNGLRLLDDLVSESANVNILDAVAVNQKGQIAALGADTVVGGYRALLLTPVAGAATGDLDGDGVVDGADLGMLLGDWNQPGSADFNEDGTVDGADLGILLGLWGPVPN